MKDRVSEGEQIEISRFVYVSRLHEGFPTECGGPPHNLEIRLSNFL